MFAQLIFYFIIAIVGVIVLVKYGVRRGWIIVPTKEEKDEKRRKRLERIQGKKKALKETQEESTDLGSEIYVSERLIDKKEDVANKAGQLSNLDEKLYPEEDKTT